MLELFGYFLLDKSIKMAIFILFWTAVLNNQDKMSYETQKYASGLMLLLGIFGILCLDRDLLTMY